jgi:hypothetical protein
MAKRYNLEWCMEDRVEEIKTELRDIDSVMLVMRMERDELRRELRRYQEHENSMNGKAAPVNEMHRRQLG